MQIIKQSVECLGYCPDTLQETMEHIETAGRTCYKSEKNKTEVSAEPFCWKMFDREHTAMVEHSWKAIKIKYAFPYNINDLIPSSLLAFPFLHKHKGGKIGRYTEFYIVGNYRAWVDYLQTVLTGSLKINIDKYTIFSTLDDCIAMIAKHFGWGSSPSDTEEGELPVYYETVNNEDLLEELRAITFRFIISRCVSHELVRHRPFTSFAQESQRYVRYDSKGGIEFIEPHWFATATKEQQASWIKAVSIAEKEYTALRKSGISPQDARTVLPNSTKTEIVVTAPVFQWRWILHLRNASPAYPPMREVMGKTEYMLDNLLSLPKAA